MSNLKYQLERNKQTALFWKYAEKEYACEKEIKKDRDEAFYSFVFKRFNK